uniref:thiol reductase thioredoxin n=1 Tax=Paenibacillus xylanexedens TaxID=528191 RepID=UPI00119CD8F6
MERIESEEEYGERIKWEGVRVIKLDRRRCVDWKNADGFMGDVIEEDGEKRLYGMDGEELEGLGEENGVCGI